jgi:glutathione S-transferase
MAARTLVTLSYSPWSERARWALDHHRLSYRELEHAPFLGELRLRRLVGGRKKIATVPLLIEGETVLTESWDIAQYADRVGTEPKLIPTDKEGEIRSWIEIADAISAAGRPLVVFGLMRDPRAVDEGLPFVLPSWLRPAMRPFTRIGMKWFARKYDLRNDEAAQEESVREGLSKLRAGLQKCAPYLAGAFSYADIAMATVLQGVSPVGNEYIRLGPATRAAWTRPRLVEEFPMLLQWRDDLYARHRRARDGGGPK